MNLLVILIGMAFGFLIVASGLSSYTVIHDMLLLREPDVSFSWGPLSPLRCPCCGYSGGANGKRPWQVN